MAATEILQQPRRALLIATDTYADPGLATLRAPTGDVRELGDVLADPAIGGFEVRPVLNASTQTIKDEIEGFFDGARRDDLLLLYISGHGVLSQTRRFFFATATTRLDRLRASGVEDGFVIDVMKHSRARTIVFILDCCHSGAFGRGGVAKAGRVLDIGHGLEGYGRITLTASTELEYAYEESPADGVTDLNAAQPGSLFTRFLVEGLRSGGADRNEDGFVSMDELYDYVVDCVRQHSNRQRPGKHGTGYGEIVIARSPGGAALPPELRGIAEHPEPAVRLTAINVLLSRRRHANGEITVAIDRALARAATDPDANVALAAEAAIRELVPDAAQAQRDEPTEDRQPAQAPAAPSAPPPVERCPKCGRPRDADFCPCGEYLGWSPMGEQNLKEAARLAAEGRVDEARAAYEAVIETGDRGVDASAAYDLGVLLEGVAEPEAATAAYERAVGRRDALLTSQALTALGRLHYAAGRRAQALDAFGQAMHTSPEAGAWAVRAVAEFFEANGDAQGRRDAVRRGLELAEPEASEPLEVRLIATLADQGNPADAIEVSRAAAASPDREVAVPAGAYLGWLLEADDDLDGARAALEPVASTDDDDGLWASNTLGRVLTRQGDLDGARKLFEASIAAGNLRARLWLADVLRRQGDLDAARAAYLRVIETDPPAVPEARYRLGQLLAEQNDLGGAATQYQAVIDSGDPYYTPPAWNSLGCILDGQGDLDGARSAFGAAAESGHPEVASQAARNLAAVVNRDNPEPDRAATDDRESG